MMDHSKINHGKMQNSGNPAMGHGGHDHHAMMISDFRKRFYVVLVLTLPIMLLSTMIQQFVGIPWQFEYSPFILMALSFLFPCLLEPHQPSVNSFRLEFIFSRVGVFICRIPKS